jgi:Fe-S-cluster containining protein
VTVETEDPTSIEDVDHLLWLLAHKNIQLFVDDGLYVQFITPCKHQDGKCAIYPNRPDICMDYGLDACETSGKDKRIYLKDHKELLSYIKEHKHDLWQEVKDKRQLA